jgi:hypothetical protein
MSSIEMYWLSEASFNNYKEDWERTRQICFITALSAGSNIKNSRQLMPFPWDIQPEPLTPQQIEDSKHVFDKFLAMSPEELEKNLY